MNFLATTNLISAIDGEINIGVIIKSGERNAKGLGLLKGALGGGDSNNLLKLARGEKGAKLSNNERGSGSSAETEDHPAAHILDGLDGGNLLEIVLGEGGGGRGRGGGGERSDGGGGAAEEGAGGAAAEREGRRRC